MALAVVQSVSAQSAAAGPVSLTLTPTLTGAGNLLVMSLTVAATSGPTITDPANWVLLRKAQGGTLAHACYYYPNNPGGINSVVVSIGGTSVQSVAGSVFEYSGTGPGVTVDVTNLQSGGIGGTITDPFTTTPMDETNELLIISAGVASTSAITATLSPEYVLGSAFPASSGGSPNVRSNMWGGTNPGPSQPTQSLVLPAVAWAVIFARLATNLSTTINRDASGVWVLQRA